MSASELFPESAVSKLSPRLEWLKRHNLALGELPDGRRYCVSEYGMIVGPTHKECEIDMALQLEVDHWEVEEFKKAGAEIPGTAIRVVEDEA